MMLSTLSSTIEAYLNLKKSLGRRFRSETDVLEGLQRFVNSRDKGADTLDAESFAAWTLTLGHLSPTVRRNRMRIVRNLCLYRRRAEPYCFVPDINTFPAAIPPAPPYIFSPEEIVRLLRVASELRRRSDTPLCPEAFRLGIVLLYTAGLRRGELVRLTLGDYDRAERTLLIRRSKFHKSRLIPVSEDAVHEMDIYLQARARLPQGSSSPLLANLWGGRVRGYSGPSFGRSLKHLFGRAEIHTADGRLPRVHDIRHTYAVHTLLRWYRVGIDIQTKLPVLAAVMGHVSIASTEYYLPFIEPIAQAASARFAEHWQSVLPTVLDQAGGTS